MTGADGRDVETVERDGCIVLEGLLSAEAVAEARRDFERLYEADVAARQAQGHAEAAFTGPSGQTILTAPSHLMLDVCGKSARFDQLLEEVLGHPRVRRLLQAWAGPSVRIGGANIRYMTGAYDPPPAHELHRDGPGAMNLGLMLTDVEPGDNGATAVLPGSHWLPSCPRWDLLFEEPFRLKKDPGRSGRSAFLRYNLFSQVLKRRLMPKVTGAFGKAGDVYFFANGEVWHGRLPNLHGRRAMICLVGLYPVDADAVTAPVRLPRETIDRLPPRLAQGLGGPFPLNDPGGTFLERLYRTRPPASKLGLFYWARQERRLAEWLSERLA